MEADNSCSGKFFLTGVRRKKLLQEDPEEIVLLLSEADLLSPEQQKEVVRFFRTALQREIHEEFPIFLYSIRLETERWKERLKNEVFRPLARNREEEFVNILLHKVQSVGKGCLNYLEIALKASRQADLDREKMTLIARGGHHESEQVAMFNRNTRPGSFGSSG